MSERSREVTANTSAIPGVVVVGAGFGGLSVVRRLRYVACQVTVIDKSSQHLFQPLLYQVATGVLSPGEIAPPLREVLRRRPNVRVVLGEVAGFDLARRVVTVTGADSEQHEVPYDILVVAAGAETSYFGHDDWAPHLYPLKTLEQAIDLRSRLLRSFEIASEKPDPAIRRAWTTFAIVGGGPAGVELAGQLATIARQFRREYRMLDTTQARIVVADSGAEILSSFPKLLSTRARRKLERMGVEFRLGQLAVGVDECGIDLKKASGEGERVDARTVIWAAGVDAASLARTLAGAAGLPVDKKGRIKAEPGCTLLGHPEIFVIGDMADQQGLPGLCEPAMQEGWYVARAIRRKLACKVDPPPFRYRDLGTLATISATDAVADIFGLKLSGLPGKLAWAFVHVAFLIGWGNRFFVLARWFWGIVVRNRGERVVLNLGPRRPSVAPA
ncbi:MAG: NAD(P)/FAD-dependent oxidoreductase [Candidatus Dormibacteraceae bacterium]